MTTRFLTQPEVFAGASKRSNSTSTQRHSRQRPASSRQGRSFRLWSAALGICALLAGSTPVVKAQGKAKDKRPCDDFYTQLNQIATNNGWGKGKNKPRTGNQQSSKLQSPMTAAAVVQTDYAEGNASSWSTFAADGRATSVSDDSTKVKVGSQSIKFVTQSGLDTGVRYPASGNAQWDLTGKQLLSFWVYAENTTPYQFQGNQPIIVLKSNGGSWTYTPNRIAFSNFNWTHIDIPLEGSSDWVRTVSGNPIMSNVSQLEIHGDTWDYGFNLYIDGVTFDARLPNPVPASPANAGPLKPRVLLYCFNPVMENKGGVRQNVAYGWQDPVSLANQVVSDLRTASHDVVQYQIVETVVADQHPYFADGFQHTDESFDSAWQARSFHNSTFDYARFIAENNLGPRIDSGDLDEIWIYSGPISGTYESTMAGNGSYWINGLVNGVNTQRAFVIMGWNFERGVGEAIHSYGHRAESILSHSYGPMADNQSNNWNKFTVQDRNLPGLAGLGNVHFPHNGQADYDYANTRLATSNADDWANYPHFANVTRSFNRNEWTPSLTDPQREYLDHWYSHMPHFSGIGYDGFLNNWWHYITDVNQFKAGNGNFLYSECVPTVTLSTPTDGAVVYGVVPVQANAAVDGALGRVELYVDGQLYATDYQYPYSFNWDTANFPGQHTLTAKAYEVVLGNVATSPAVHVTVPSARVSISDVSVVEANAATPQAVFNVTLDRTVAEQVKVDFTTADGTATAGADYTPASGTLTFAPGETQKSIAVPILTDIAAEPSETFFVRLSNVQLGFIQDGEGLGTIVDNSAPTSVSVQPASLLSISGTPRTLTAVYSDPNGAQNLTQVLLAAGPAGAPALQAFYDIAAGKLYLRNDADTGWLGGFAPGSANQITNSRGSLDCAATSVAQNGNTLTVAWSLTPSQTLTGTNDISLKCVDFGSLTSNWVVLGAWEVHSPPGNQSLSPVYSANTAGQSRTFTATYTDADGANDITQAYLLANTSASVSSGLCGFYDAAANQLYLRNNDDSGWLGGFAPGSPNQITNGQGSLNCATTTVGRNGNQLIVCWAFTPSYQFAGIKNLYMQAVDTLGNPALWEDKGDWLVKESGNTAPVAVSVSPSSGTGAAGTAKTFTAVYSDAQGVLDIREADLLLNATANPAAGLCGYYDAYENKLYLRNDANGAWLGGFAPGSANTISNSQGTLNCATTSVTRGGNTLTVDWSLTPSASFIGAKNLYLRVVDSEDTATAFDDFGDWLVKAAQNTAPQTVSLTPAASVNAAGTAATFTATYQDADGSLDLKEAHLVVNTTAVTANGLAVYYDAYQNKLYLRNDADTAWLGGFAPGSANIISNNRGVLNCTNTTVARTSNGVTINWYLTPTSAFLGVKNLYLRAIDTDGAESGFVDQGDWLVKAAANTTPVIQSLSPSLGAGLGTTYQTFTATYQDADGTLDLRELYLQINATSTTTGAFYAYYDTYANKLYVRDSTDTGWLGGIAPGANSIISGSQGALNCLQFSVVRSGNSITVNWNVNFTSTFMGTKNLYLRAVDTSNATTGTVDMGDWLIKSTNTAPTNVSVTPNTGTTAPGVARTLTAVYGDSNGALDIREAYLLVNSTTSGASALYGYYDQYANKLYLRDNANGAWLGGFAPGSANTISNSQGSLNCASTSVSRSGNNLTVNWNFTPASSFTNNKNLYLRTVDSSSAAANLADLGDWRIK